MTFEEFFKKKKINLSVLSQEEPALFSEFKAHFEDMGEKSFDYTKKYWFNKLRLRFPAPVEIKADKIRGENPLAEQTITEALTEEAAKPAANIGFKPKFKASMVSKATITNEEPSINNPAEASKSDASSQNTELSEPPPAKLGFKPKFNASMVKKTASEIEQKKDEPETNKPAEPTKEESPSENTEAKPPAYKPRFNMKNIKPKSEE